MVAGGGVGCDCWCSGDVRRRLGGGGARPRGLGTVGCCRRIHRCRHVAVCSSRETSRQLRGDTKNASNLTLIAPTVRGIAVWLLRRQAAGEIIERLASRGYVAMSPMQPSKVPGLCGWDGPRLPIFLSTWIAPRCGPRVAQSVVVLCFPRDDDRAWSCRRRMGAVQQSWCYVTIRRSRATRSNIRYATTQPVHAHARHRQARS